MPGNPHVEYVEAGDEKRHPDATNPPPQTSAPEAAPAPPPPPVKSYDFLSTWKVPAGGFARWIYNMKLSYDKEFASQHKDYLVYQQYLRDLERVQQDHVAFIREAETQYLIERLRFLHNSGVRAIMAFCNIKSAGKTTDLLQVASVMAEYTRGAVLALPATQNNATSTLALMAGINPEQAITIEELSRRIDEMGYYLALSKEVPKTPNGVMVVSEDLNNALDVDNQYNLEKFIELLLKVLPHVDYVFLDLGNDNIRNDSIALAAARLSHVLNFSFLYGKAVPTRAFVSTVQGYNTDLREVDLELFGGNADTLKLTGLMTKTPEKVSKSIVIANLAPLDEEVPYSEYMTPLQHVDADPLPLWSGKGINLPYDPYLDNADASGKVKPALIQRVTDVTHRQALRIAVANLEEAARMQGIKLSTEGSTFVPPPVPEVPHPFPDMLRAN